MSEPKHTPTPWEVTRGRSYLDEEMQWMVAGVAHFGDGPNAERNARLAARAVNCHQELVEALEKAADTFRDMAVAYDLFGKPVAADAARIAEAGSRAALSKARPEGKGT